MNWNYLHIPSWWYHYNPVPSTTPVVAIDRLQELSDTIYATIKDLQLAHDKHHTDAISHAKAGRLDSARSEIELRMLHAHQLSRIRRTLTAVTNHILKLREAALNSMVMDLMVIPNITCQKDSTDTIDQILAYQDDVDELGSTLSERPSGIDMDLVDRELGLLMPDAPKELAAPVCVDSNSVLVALAT